MSESKSDALPLGYIPIRSILYKKNDFVKIFLRFSHFFVLYPKIFFYQIKMNILMKIAALLQKRPSDVTIRMIRIAFGVLYSGLLYYNLIYLGKNIENEYFFGTLILDEQGMYVAKWTMITLGIFPLFLGITQMCLLRTKYMRICQLVLSFLVFYVAGSIEATPDLDFGVLIGLLGVVPLFSGITGKMIPSKCLKYKEKITKIRV